MQFLCTLGLVKRPNATFFFVAHASVATATGLSGQLLTEDGFEEQQILRQTRSSILKGYRTACYSLG